MSGTQAPIQETLFDISGREFNLNWIDESQPLFVAHNPLYWKAHKLQIMIARLEKQSANNPAQFNSSVYYQAVNALEDLMQKINRGETSEILDERSVAEIGDAGAETEVGEGVTVGVGARVSADNPLTR